jgi:iron complex outermembrane receptor protein
MLAISTLAALQLANAQTAAKESSATDQIIVTGTRATGTKATQSVSPIAVISSDALERTGQASVIDALLRLEPTFQTQAKGGDIANMVRSASLRGLSANQTLVLVNGKRRNTTAYISTGGYTSGASAVDLDLIPATAVERVEVLKDGAAAQYGSDAIAGVLNIILKKGTDGSIDVGVGQFEQSKINPNGLGNGKTVSLALDKGFALGSDGFVHLSGEYRDHKHTNQTGPELRSMNANVARNGGPVDKYEPNTNGDPAYTLYSAGYNAGYNLNADLEIYTFGNYASRKADSWQNNRPNELARASTCFYPPGSSTVVRTNSPTGIALTSSCTTIDVGDLAKKVYPQGFFIPIETLKEDNLALAAGVRGGFWSDARWDASLSYGSDKMDIGVENSLNYSYLLTPVTANPLGPNGTSPTSAYIGQYANSQVMGNFDISKPFNIGLYAPLDVSVGVEARRDSYKIKEGDTAGWSNGGMQGFIGQTPQDAVSKSRTERGAYLDLSTNFSAKWTAGAALRAERYSDSGSTTTGKLSSRYDFNTMFALRGTVSSGFRAPTMAEQLFTTTTVGPTAATVFLPADSPAAALVGAKPLGPEKSKNVSLGVVFTPTRDLRFTADAYYISITDRILLTSLNASLPAPQGGATGTVRQAIALRGVVLPPTATDSGTSVAIFQNGIDLNTYGLDLAASTSTDLGGYGKIQWNAAANFKRAKVVKSDPSLFSPATLAGLTDTPPKSKIVTSADWSVGPWTTTLRVTRFGEAFGLSTPSGVAAFPTTPYTRVIVRAAFVEDVEVGYQVTPALNFHVGINNLSNQRPTKTPDDILYGTTAASKAASTGVGVYPTFSPYGINGSYYYARASYKF